MVRKKIAVIFGTRPEAIKLAPVILKLKSDPRFNCQVCVTAQHREMLDQVLDVFGIVPDHDMNLMRPDQSLGELTGRAIPALDKYLKECCPDQILVQGDTTTVFCAALAAFYNRIPVGHVEAGLRTFNKYAPWPEEVNRVLTTHLADIHFAPTTASRSNLIREGIAENVVHVTGNTVIDALFIALEKIQREHLLFRELPDPIMQEGKSLVLITGHRRENYGEGFHSICRAIVKLAESFPDCWFVYPVHLNPNVRKPVDDILGRSTHKNILLLEPLTYLPFVTLMNRATLIMTDSGGVQEEAPSLGKPVLVLRETTERPEAVDAGTVKLVGTDEQKIVKTAQRLLTDAAFYKTMSSAHNPYGDGHASERIVQLLSKG